MLFVFAALVSVVSGQGGSCTGLSCTDCLTNGAGACGWCAATKQCLAGNALGPTGGSFCVGRGQWSWGNSAAACPSCSQYDGDCRACTLSNADCGWCDSKQKCLSVTDLTTCGAPLSPTCPCGFYQNCAQCTVFSDGNCGWCSKSQSCESVNNVNATACGTIAHDCPCSANRNCDSCRADFNAVVGGQHVACAWCEPPRGMRRENITRCNPIGQCPTGTNATFNCPSACATHSDCRRCQENGCEWCHNTNTCSDHDTLPAGCFVSHQCPRDDCESIGACDVCRSQGCTWCFDLNVCTTRGSPVSQTCKSDAYSNCSSACAAQKNCGTCELMTGCAWCAVNDTTSCIDKGFHQCLGVVKACDAGFAVGTFFLGWLVFALILGVLFGAFVVYRRRSGRPVYTAI